MNDETLNRVLACNLRLQRQAKGWSQEALAARCELHRTYVGAIERGERNITLQTLERLALALDVPALTLLEA